VRHIGRLTGLMKSFAPQNPIQFGFQGAPAAADFDGFDAAFGNILEVGRPGNFKVLAGLFGGINDVVAVFTIKPVAETIRTPVETAAPIGSFAPIFTAPALNDVIVYHICHPEIEK
jgi:hypothetical protein